MATRKTDAAGPVAPSAADVAAFLRSHPDFLRDHPDVLAEILPARNVGEGVADLQSHALRRLKVELDDMKAGAQELITNARSNMSTLTRTHQAVLAALAAEGVDKLAQALVEEVPLHLEVDVAVLCFEPGLPPEAALHVHEIQDGAVDRLIGTGATVRLRPRIEQEQALYGAGSRLVQSDAIVRLPTGNGLPPGLLAIGSRDVGTFQVGQGTELLIFLGTVLAHCVRRWAFR